jgi:hypothetical protein
MQTNLPRLLPDEIRTRVLETLRDSSCNLIRGENDTRFVPLSYSHELIVAWSRLTDVEVDVAINTLIRDGLVEHRHIAAGREEYVITAAGLELVGPPIDVVATEYLRRSERKAAA